MNSKNTKIIIAVVLLVLVGFLVFKLKPASQDSTMTEPKESMVAVDDSSMFSGNVFDLLKGGNTVSCTYSSQDDEYTLSGTTYVSGKNMRSDSTMILDGQAPIETHMISDGTYVYSWSSAAPQGIKMKIEEVDKPAEDSDATTPVSDKKVEELAKDYDFKCTKWSTDSSRFVVPSNVQFTDFSTMMAPTQGTPSGACTACNYMQDAESKAECKKQLKCE